LKSAFVTRPKPVIYIHTGRVVYLNTGSDRGHATTPSDTRNEGEEHRGRKHKAYCTALSPSWRRPLDREVDERFEI